MSGPFFIKQTAEIRFTGEPGNDLPADEKSDFAAPVMV